MLNKRTLLLSTILGFASTGGMAQTVVKQLNDDTLRVTQYKGKPPLKRTVITRDAHPALFAHYAELIDHNPQPLFISTSRNGAPGKSLPRQAGRVSGEPQEVTEFARAEESQDHRQWRGAPGKSHLRVQNR